jgi:WD40 repeat protein
MRQFGRRTVTGAALGGVLATTLAPRPVQPASAGGGKLALRRVARVRLAGAVITMAWSPDGRRLVVPNGWGSRLAVIDTANWRVITSVMRAQSFALSTLGFASGGQEVVTLPVIDRRTHDNEFAVGVFETDTGRPLRDAPLPGGLELVRKAPTEIAVSPDGRYAVTVVHRRAPRGSVLLVYDVQTATLVNVLDPPFPAAFHVPTIGPDNRLAVSIVRGGAPAAAHVRKTLNLFELPSLRPILSFPTHIPSIASAAWSPSGDRLLTGAHGLVQQLDPATGEPRLWRDPDPIRVWAASSGRLLASFAGEFEPIVSVAWHPSGEMFMTHSAKGTGERGSLVQIFPAAGGPPLLQHFARGALLTIQPSFHPDGELLAWGEDSDLVVLALTRGR